MAKTPDKILRVAGATLCTLPALLALFFLPSLEFPFTTAKTATLFAFCGLLALLLVPMRFAIAGDTRERLLRIGLALLAFVSVAVVSAFASPLRYMTVEKTGWYLTGPLLLYFGAVGLRGRHVAFFRIVGLSAIAVAVIGLLQVAIGRDFLFPMFGHSSMASGRMRLFSTSGNPNFVAALLAASAPSLVALLTTRNFAHRCLSLLSLMLASIVLYFAGARVGWLAFGIGFAATACLFWASKRKALTFTLAALAVVALTLLVSSRNPRAVSESLLGRSVLWRSTLAGREWARPLGSGPGTFAYLYPTRAGKYVTPERHPELQRFVANESYALNDYVQLWSELGVIGLAFFLAVIAVWFKSVVRFLRSIGPPPLEIAVAVGTVAAILTLALFDSPLQRAETWALFWISLSVPYAQSWELADGENVRPLRILGSLSLAAALFWAALAPALASYYIQRGQQAESIGNTATALHWYGRALQFDRSQPSAHFNRARTLAKLEMYPAAWAESTEMLRWVNEPECWILRARIASELGNGELASQQLKIAKELFPSSAAVEREISLHGVPR